MKITRENYEAFFIDLLDGELSIAKVNNLLDFLRENPDLADELKDLEKIKIEPVPEEQYNFERLLKSDLDQPDVLEEACIRSIENELSASDEEKLQHYIRTHPYAANEYRLFKATINKPDPLIVFEDIEGLKKTKKFQVAWYAVAAVLLTGVLFWFSNKNQSTKVFRTSITAFSEKPDVKLEVPDSHPQLIKFAETENIPDKKTNGKTETKRKTEEILLPISARSVLVRVEHPNENLFALQISRPGNSKGEQIIYPAAKELLTNKIAKIDAKAGANKLVYFALKKLKSVTHNRLDYRTGTNGKLDKIEYNSRLLAFSVPLDKNGD